MADLSSAKSQEINTYHKSVRIWLLIGVVMILIQVLLGGITRLTGSGLSITKWEIVTGSFPPLNEADWKAEFDLYKQTPQFEKINHQMDLNAFKFIYFWEFIHRLWGRLMGLVFFFPFAYFIFKKWIDNPLIKKLGIVIVLAALTASFGWIMVASGLIERPWVNAYKLTLHLGIAFFTYSYLIWTTFWVWQRPKSVIHNRVLKKWTSWLLGLVVIQILLGGLMSGIRAAMAFPTWPKMYNSWIPDLLFYAQNWNYENFVDYDNNAFMPALVQVLHRTVAYILIISGIWYFIKGLKYKISPLFNRTLWIWFILLLVQVTLGIFTVINSALSIPVALGVLHQMCGLLLLSIILYLYFQFKEN